MSKYGFGSIVAACSLMVLGFAGASQAEDASPAFINCGPACGVGIQASADTIVSALPGATVVITLAHLAPSPEDAFVRGRQIECRPVAFRVDTLNLGGEDGFVEVELGERQTLKPGQSMRIVHRVDKGNNTSALPSEMSQMTFRVRAERVSSRCDFIASGMVFEDDSSLKAQPFSLLVSDGVRRLGRFGHY